MDKMSIFLLGVAKSDRLQVVSICRLMITTLFMVAGSGCAGTPRVEENTATLRVRNVQLRAHVRQSRNKIRDLQNQVVVLKDKLEAVRLGKQTIQQAATASIDPVEVMEPPDWSRVETVRADYQVVGIDSNGAEIVYVGEAAKEDSVSPQVEQESLPTVRSETVRTVRKEFPPLDKAFDRLPVSKSVPALPKQPIATTKQPPSKDTKPSQPAPALKTSSLAKASPPKSGTPRKQYEQYYTALRAGKHEQAIVGFRAFLKLFPKHSYADNALYWLGEAYYDQKQYSQAMSEFQRVIREYPKGNKAADALLKVGFCLLALGEIDEARKVFERVVDGYPKSHSAGLANTRLEQLAVQ